MTFILTHSKLRFHDFYTHHSTHEGGSRIRAAEQVDGAKEE